MSTRSIVGMYTSEDLSTWEAVYCHSDGYMKGVGQQIYTNWITTFNGNGRALGEFLISPRVGWSSLWGDFSIAPSWENTDGPRWYDDRPGEENSKRMVHTHEDDPNDAWIEWAYLIDPYKNELYIFYYMPQKNDLVAIVTLESATNMGELESSYFDSFSE